jgi:hypothetical protein
MDRYFSLLYDGKKKGEREQGESDIASIRGMYVYFISTIDWLFRTNVVNSKRKKNPRKWNDGVNIRWSIEFYFYMQFFSEYKKPLEIVCLLIAYSYFRFFFFLCFYRNSLNCQERIRIIGKKYCNT